MDLNVITLPQKSNEFDDEPSFGHVLLMNLSAAGDKVVLISGITSEDPPAKESLERSIEVAKALKTADMFIYLRSCKFDKSIN